MAKKTILYFFEYLLLFLGLGIGINLVLVAILYLPHLSDPDYNIYAAMGDSWVLLATATLPYSILFIYYLLLRKPDFSLGRLPRSGKPLLILLLSISLLIVGTIISVTGLTTVIADGYQSTAYNSLIKISNNPLVFITATIIGPTTEEIVFRGFILRTLLEKKDWNYWIPIVISAVLFAIVHTTLLQIPTAFLLGLALGWVFYQTRSICPTIFFHVIWNGSSAIGSLLTMGQHPESPKSSDLFILILLGAIIIYVAAQELITLNLSDRKEE